VFSALHAHLVLVTKYRRGVLDGDMLTCYQDAMRKACDDFAASLPESSGETGHVHLLVYCPPKASAPAPVNSVKGVSERRLRPQHTGRVNRATMNGHFWSPSRLAASCGGAPLSIIAAHRAAVPPGLTAGPGFTPP
jgi:putative transposase